ncbi:hypothetical protein GPL17_33240 [Bradyrhizobium yuanmingense]|uniref:hypothetical protein n=1 Tax=Bradyrhizobium yuanmingense TaxID=108015 RepID=UPI0012F7F3E1|nr:hypothetical protein [Bradyrhizobium yuanmingense]MVT55299.1 hypothetical protein [Bradyrhizobium yuanmingense]
MDEFRRLDPDFEAASSKSLGPFAEAGDLEAADEEESTLQLASGFSEEVWSPFARVENDAREPELRLINERVVDQPGGFTPIDGGGLIAQRTALNVAELVELWELVSALNERLHRIIVQVLRQPARSFDARFPPEMPTARALREGEFGDLERLTEEEAEQKDDKDFINGLIANGLSENDATNEAFYRRNPKLRGQQLRADSKEAEQWSRIRDREVRPAAKALIGSAAADPVLLATFFSQYEGDSRVPATATEQFLTRSPLLSMGRTLRDRVLGRWRAGKPPLTIEQLYQIAYDVSGQAGPAMLLCHNVTKAFARGGVAITWDRVGSAPDTYSDGKRIWTPAVIHRAGKILRTYNKTYKRELPSIYYVLFSVGELGTSDPGDWYHYYVAATMAAYGASNELLGGVPRAREYEEEDRKSVKDDVVAQAYPLLVADRVLDLERQMSNPDLVALPGYRGWVLANVMSFLEGGHYGAAQDEVARESRFHLRGAVAGLRTRGIKPGKNWVWYVPGAKSLSQQELAFGFQLQFKTAEALDATGQRVGPQKKGPK